MQYVRLPDASASDSLITGAYMGTTVVLVGENLRSIKYIYFNDQQSVINTSYVTDNTFFVEVPNFIPEVVNNLITMVTRDGDTVTYDFNVLVPGPTITSLSNEYAKAGDQVVLYGDYLIDDPNVPLAITFGDVPVTDIKEISKTAVTFTMPEVEDETTAMVTTIYGSAESPFHYKDTRGIMFEFDGLTGLTNHGWHAQVIETDETAISGNFLRLGDPGVTLDKDGGWNDGNFSFEYWCGDWNTPQGFVGPDAKLNDLVDFSNWENMSLKFEMYIPSSNPWSAGAMQIFFGGIDVINIQMANNTFFHDQNPSLPRALYRPWQTASNKSYDTGDKWVTVTIPFTQFIFDENGSPATGVITPDYFASLTIFVWSGGVEGTECQPVIKIDNIRAVPNK